MRKPRLVNRDGGNATEHAQRESDVGQALSRTSACPADARRIRGYSRASAGSTAPTRPAAPRTAAIPELGEEMLQVRADRTVSATHPRRDLTGGPARGEQNRNLGFRQRKTECRLHEAGCRAEGRRAPSAILRPRGPWRCPPRRHASGAGAANAPLRRRAVDRVTTPTASPSRWSGSRTGRPPVKMAARPVVTWSKRAGSSPSTTKFSVRPPTRMPPTSASAGNR